MARPTKRSPEVETAILNALRVGNTKTDSVLATGISYDTFARWFAADAEFRVAVEKAEADARLRFVGIIATASRTSWQAAAWFLERRNPEHWGRRERVDMTIDLRREAERLAVENGLDVDEVMAEAERVISGAK